MVPNKVFLTKGVGRHREKLESFEAALRNAGIAQYNLVRVSSILPPNCEIIDPELGKTLLKPGEITFCVLSDLSSNEANRLLSASIGLAIPADPQAYGYLSEHHAFGQPEKVAGDYAEDLAASMLASILGIEFDPDASWDEKRQIWQMHGKIVKTRNITQSATVGEDGMWTTVVAAAVFIPPDK
ncbi:MAG TPA: arginine decarboxylase, pyruvoyl-dependent [Clostridia bacterium]|jgi:arginine decarboxylase|nr:arginine decarboxylase, pyruvoyl-dependent [Clostridia bacterium]